MPIFGLMTKKEFEAGVQEAVKAAMLKDAPRWLLELADSEQYQMPDPSIYEHQAQMYRVSSWVLTAVAMAASSGSLTPFSVARVVAGKEPKDIPNHPFEMLLKRPNPMDSRYEFLYATIASFKLNGNAYWYNNAADQYAAPDELWYIQPHKIVPVPDGQSFLRGYLYYPGNGREILLEPWQIIHFKTFNPFTPFVGLSALEALAIVLRGDLGMQSWNSKYFNENNARLPGILAFEQMIEGNTWDKIKEDTREASKKRELLMLRGTGQGGLKWLQNSISQKEMEFLEGRIKNKEEVWSVLAPGLMSMLSESATEANSRTGAAVFNERTVYPLHVMMAEKISNELLPKYGSDRARPLVGHFEDIRITDRQLELEEQKLFAETHTLSEIREEYYGDDPLGDERDKLLPKQINAQSGGIQEPPMPKGAQPVTNKPQQEMMSAQNKQPDDMERMKEQQMDESKKAMLDELARYERKAVKSVGKAVDFVSDILPDSVIGGIQKGLPNCTSVTAVKALFDVERGKFRQPKQDTAGALAVLDGLRAVLAERQTA